MRPTADDGPAGETIALTGATGFIGTRLQARLLADGYRVRALIRPGSAADRLLPGVEAVELALDAEDMSPRAITALSGASTVIYCAGAVRGRDRDDFAAANETGVRTIARAASGLPTPPRVLLVSSLAATEPELSHYAASKRAGERVLEDYPSVAWTIFRPPAVYGPGDKELKGLFGLARRGIVPVIGSRSQRISLIHVEDLVSAVCEWLKTPQPCEHRVFSMDDGHPHGYGWEQIGAAAHDGRTVLFGVPRWLLDTVAAANLRLARLFGYLPMLTPGKVRELCHESWLSDNAAFRDATGWEPEIGLAEGLARLFGERSKT